MSACACGRCVACIGAQDLALDDARRVRQSIFGGSARLTHLSPDERRSREAARTVAAKKVAAALRGDTDGA